MGWIRLSRTAERTKLNLWVICPMGWIRLKHTAERTKLNLWVICPMGWIRLKHTAERTKLTAEFTKLKPSKNPPSDAQGFPFIKRRGGFRLNQAVHQSKGKFASNDGS